MSTKPKLAKHRNPHTLRGAVARALDDLDWIASWAKERTAGQAKQLAAHLRRRVES